MYSAVCGITIAIFTTAFSNAAQINKYADGAIVYPGPIKDVLSNRQGPVYDYHSRDVPKECKNQGFCTIKPKNYPQEKFDSMFNGLIFVPKPTPEIDDNRQGDPEEKDGCESVVSFEPLYKVKSLKGEWRNVIQSPNNNFVQKVRLETCKEPGGKCFTIFPHMPNFVVSCKQKYNIWELLVEGDNGSETVKTDLPVCCSCVYRSSNVGSRSAIPDDED